MARWCSGEGTRTVLWMCWVANFLITSIFYILSFATCANLVRSYKLLNIEISNQIWRAPVAASLLGGLLVLLFNILSCAILIKKSIQKGGPGFGYGFVCAFCLTLAFFCLLCGLVLDGFTDTVKDQLAVKLASTWSDINTGVYLGTIGFAYICFVMFILFFCALVFFQGAVTEELGLPPVRGVNTYQGLDHNQYAVGMQDPNLMSAPGQHQGGPLGMKVPPGQPMPQVGSPAQLNSDAAGTL